jgi:fatty-acid desaturase
LARFIERTKYDWWSTTWKLAIFVAVVLFALLVVYPWRGFLPTFLVILTGLWVFVGLVSRSSGFRCDKCGRAFQVPTAINFFTASAVGKNADGTYYSYKTLTCPHCRQSTKARLVKRVDPQAAKGSGRLLK